MSKMTKTIAALGVVAGLGVAAMPLSSYAADREVEVSANVLGSIAITTDAEGETTTDTGTLNLGDVTPGSSVVSKTLNVTISTNSDKGYDLTLIDADEDASLVNKADANQKIPAATTVAQGKTAWGVRGGDLGTSAWKAVPASGDVALTVKENAGGTPLAGGSETTGVTFGVSVAEGAVAAGEYTSTVVFTATSK